MNKKLDIFFSKIRSDKKIQFIVIFVLVATMLICLFINPITKTTKSDNSNNQVSEYVKSLEDKLSYTLSNVEKAGDVCVMITLESGHETVLATKITKTETQNGIEVVESPIIVNGKTVVIKENLPKIKGVLIVAEGAGNIAVFNKIQQATISLLDINLNQIEILTKK